MNAFFAGSNNVELHADGRSIFVIVGVKTQADQVGCSCKQEHHPQYRAAKKFVKKRTHQVPLTLVAGYNTHLPIPERFKCAM